MTHDQTEPTPTCAALSMYDWPEVADATDQLWTILSATLTQAGIAIPQSLDRTRSPEEIWLDPGLVLAQTCGYPYLKQLQSSTTLLGTPDYAVDGAVEAHQQSLLMTHVSNTKLKPTDFAGKTLAINGLNSQSGFNSVRLYLTQALAHTRTQAKIDPQSNSSTSPPEYFFKQIFITGSHRVSIQTVAEQQSDLCAIDPVSLALAKRYDPNVMEQLCVIGRTPLVPALPLICSNLIATNIDVESLRKELRLSFESLPDDIRQTLYLRSLYPLKDNDYEQLRNATRAACQAGYAQLAANQDHVSSL